MPDPRITGVSSISGKIVTIRHATTADVVVVEEYLKRHHADSELDNAELVVAAEDRRIIGFGILKKKNEEGCVSLFEDSRRKGIGSTIVKHLMEFAPVKKVYAARYASYFTRSGMERGETVHPARTRKNGIPCRAPLLERLAFAAYAKP
jgi:N-acetylglutamate synthase-like GNAT family acetyltransferase